MIHILGAGAMGCLWAAYLGNTQDICFASQRKTDIKTISFQLGKAFLPTSNCNKHYQFAQNSLSGHIGSPDIVLVCTKSYDSLSALQSIQPYLSSKTLLVLFQNGLGSQYQILEHFPDNPVFAAVTTEGVNRSTNAEIIHAGKGQTLLGPLNVHAQKMAVFDKCFQLLSSSELIVKKADDIGFILWKKLAINCAINPFTAIYNCANGDLLELPQFASTWPELRSELIKLLNCADYSVSESELDSAVFDVINHTRHNISSMLQDIRQQKKTEIEDINGFAWRYLEDKQIDNAINRQLWEQVNALGN